VITIKIFVSILVMHLAQTAILSPLDEVDNFESAALKTRCNKIEKTDRPPLDKEGARMYIDGWRNGKSSIHAGITNLNSIDREVDLSL
jgi:hypothetical protein